MPSGPIDKAYVEIVPQLTQFESQVDDGISGALRDAERAATVTVEDMERLFGDLGDHLAQAFAAMTDEVTRSLDDVQLNAEQNARVIESAFSGVGDDVARSIEQGTTESVAALDRLASESGQAAKKTSDNFKEAGSGLSNFMSTTLGFFAGNALMSGVSQAFDFAKNAVFGFNAQLQNAGIAFTTMLGSGQKAQAFLSQLKDFAKTTPFQFPDLVTSAQQMLGMGIAAGDIIPDLTALGDAVAGVGGGQDQIRQVTLAFDQMAAKGKLDMGNMEQLMQGGVANALQILADHFHKSTGEMIDMISTGQVMSKDALPALVQGLEQGTAHVQGLGGMMAKQSTTFTGALSNISDSLNQVLAGAFQPFFNVVSVGAQGLVNWLSSPTFTTFGTRVQSGLQGAIDATQTFFHSADAHLITDALAAVKTVFMDAVNFIRGTVVPVGRDLWDVFGPLLRDAFAALVGAARQLNDVLNPLGSALRGVFGFVDAHKTTFQAIAAAILAVVGAVKAYQIAMAIWEAVTVAATAVQTAFDVAMDANPVGLVVLAIAALAAGIIYLWTHSAAFRDFFIGMWGGIKDAAVAVANWVVGAWHAVVDFFTALPGNILSFLQNLPGMLLQLFVDALNGVLYAIDFGIGMIIRELLTLPTQIWDIIKSLWDVGTSLFRQGVEAVVSFMSALPGRLLDIASTARSWAVGALRSLVSDAVSALMTLPQRAWDAVSALPGRIRSLVSDAGTWLYQAGKDVVMGLIHGVEDVIGTAVDVVKGAMGSIVSGAMHALGIHSPSKVFADEIGREIPAGVAVGVTDNSQVATDAVNQMLMPRVVGGPAAGGGAGAAPLFGPGSINVTVGAGATAQQAYQAGQQVGQGVADALQSSPGLQWYLRPRTLTGG